MKHTDDHAWVKREGNIARVGVVKRASKELGEVVYIELPKVGTKVEAGGEMAVLESTKAAADTYAPVSGVVVEVNKKLEETPSLINSDPHGAGWLYAIKMSDPKEYETLPDLVS